MLKFGRFKTIFNVYNDKKRKSKNEYDSIENTVSITGAYRINREEFYVYNNNESQTKLTPAISVSQTTVSVPPKTAPVPLTTVPVPPKTAPVTSATVPVSPKTAQVPSTTVPVPPILPPIAPEQAVALRQTKSTSDLIKEQNLPPALREAQSGISLDPRGAVNEYRISRTPAAVDPKKSKKLDAQKKVEKQRLEEQKKLDKKRLEEEKKRDKQRLEEEKKREKLRLEEQKKREKLALQEQAKQDKLRKEQEKKELAEQKKISKKTKKPAPQRPLANPLAQTSNQGANTPVVQSTRIVHSTNTLESSISKSSGPPPYTEVPKDPKDNSNVSYSQPVDTGSWDMISQHRQNVINKTTANAPNAKQKVTSIDLNFTLGENKKGNSEV